MEVQPTSVMEVHPLQNSLILKKIFSFCQNKLDSVKIHRLVCKAWNESSESQWKLLAPLTIFQDPQHGIMEQGTTSMCQVLQDNELYQVTATTLPHKNFTLKGWTIDVDHYDTLSMEGAARLTQLFWSLCGHNIKTLSLSLCTIPYNLILLPIVLWRVVPNLENLTLTDCKMEIADVDFSLEATKKQEEEIGRKIDQEIIILDGLIKRMYQPEEAENYDMLSSQMEEHKDNLTILESQRRDMLASIAHKSLPESRQEMIKKSLQEDVDALLMNPVKLRRVRIDNLQFGPNCSIPIDWSSTVNTFPKLDYISVSHGSDREYIGGHGGYECTAQRRLKKIDVMNVTGLGPVMPDNNLLLLPTEKLSVDCGFITLYDYLQPVLRQQAAHLKKLVLFRAPFGPPHDHFLDGIMMSTLTKFHLWGNVSKDLNFLKFTPNLKTLKWNTTCYDQDTHGARLHHLLGGKEKAHVMSAEDIVKCTDSLTGDFKLESLETLEMVSGALSLSSVKKLGKWFPNLIVLKTVIVGDDEMIQIGAQWPNLKSLELAHGSEVLADAIITVCYSRNEFQRLKSFTWRPCSCERRVFGVPEMYAVHLLRKRAGDNVVHAWKRSEEMPNKKPYRADCVEGLFKKAFDGGKNVDKFKREINSSL